MKTEESTALPENAKKESHPVRNKSRKALEDHSYALGSPDNLKKRLHEAYERIGRLEKKNRNSRCREKRAKTTLKIVLEDLRSQEKINEELENLLSSYRGK